MVVCVAAAEAMCAGAVWAGAVRLSRRGVAAPVCADDTPEVAPTWGRRAQERVGRSRAGGVQGWPGLVCAGLRRGALVNHEWRVVGVAGTGLRADGAGAGATLATAEDGAERHV